MDVHINTSVQVFTQQCIHIDLPIDMHYRETKKVSSWEVPEIKNKSCHNWNKWFPAFPSLEYYPLLFEKWQKFATVATCLQNEWNGGVRKRNFFYFSIAINTLKMEKVNFCLKKTQTNNAPYLKSSGNLFALCSLILRFFNSILYTWAKYQNKVQIQQLQAFSSS